MMTIQMRIGRGGRQNHEMDSPEKDEKRSNSLHRNQVKDGRKNKQRSQREQRKIYYEGEQEEKGFYGDDKALTLECL